MKQKIFLGTTLLVIAGVVFCFLSFQSLNHKPSHQNNKLKIQEKYGQLSLRFEKNQGQTASQVDFLSRGQGYSLFLTPTESVFTLSRQKDDSSNVLRMKIIGANPNAKAEGSNQLVTKSNYFLGNDPQKWKSNIPNYAKIKYKNIYDGIDLVYYGNQKKLEYDFVIQPGKNYKTIALRFEGTDQLQIARNGDLMISIGNEKIHQRKPVVYQNIDGQRKEINGNYVLKNKHEAGFQVAAYDKNLPLIIDPVLEYSTFLGGNLGDYGGGIAVDSLGSAYVVGTTSSTNFPTTNPYQATKAGSYDVFVTKFSVDGSSLIYSTYLGGTDDDSGLGIAVDSSGSAYVTGNAESQNFPIVNAYQVTRAGNYYNYDDGDVFVSKLSADGSSLIYSTYLGGAQDDWGKGIAVDSAGSAYVTGYAYSTDFPTVNAYQATHAGAAAGGGADDVFVTKLSVDGSSLIYSTYLGGTWNDQGEGITVNSSGNVYVTGRTNSTDFPTVNAYQPTKSAATIITHDTFVTKFSVDGSSLIYSTYLGGAQDDWGKGIAVDSAGSAYVTGYTYSADFPIVNPYQTTLAGDNDVFVTKLSVDGSSLIYSTYLGGADHDEGEAITVGSSGNAYVAGKTRSTNFPTADPYQATNASAYDYDVFVTKFSVDGSSLIYSTYLGGTDNDYGLGIAVDSSGNAYATGAANSTDFPTVNPYQATLAGPSSILIDAFVAKFGEEELCDPTNAIYVDGLLGSPAGPGGPDCPFDTITDGIANASSGPFAPIDKVVVRTWLYWEIVNLQPGIEVEGELRWGFPPIILSPSTQTTLVYGANQSTFKYFAVVGGIELGGDHEMFIEENVIIAIDRSTLPLYLHSGSDNNHFLNNLIYHEPLSSPYSIYLESGNGNQFINNTVHMLQTVAVGGQDLNAVFLEDFTGSTVENEFRNNIMQVDILTGNNVYGFFGNGSNVAATIDYNLLPTTNPGVTLGTGNITIPTGFADFVDPSPSGSDYTLNPTSLAIDVGDPDSNYNDPDGSRNDMGVFGGPDSLNFLP